ncbi:cysteine-rich secretory protein LCCL domain-containing 2-like isoform X2 [Ascaphus truei]|uniref:cysteine-rich secretory protein LCCL domain-containing 2-like isoform X2 n=2 Tax=Ascaphus truei TaxID=8439 RepID=UPI003F593DAE
MPQESVFLSIPHRMDLFVAVLLTLTPIGNSVLVPCTTTSKDLVADITEVYCPAGCLTKNLSVWGTDIYAENSPICVAAIHAGVSSNAGGLVTVEKKPGEIRYNGFTKNALTSLSSEASATSFTFTIYAATTSTTTTTTTTITTHATTPATTRANTTTTTPRSTTTIVNVSCSTTSEILLASTETVWCPEGCTRNYYVWGTDIYTSDSEMCPAAIHAGKLTVSGGYVAVTKWPGLERYVGSLRNGINTLNTMAWTDSFIFG